MNIWYTTHHYNIAFVWGIDRRNPVYFLCKKKFSFLSVELSSTLLFRKGYLFTFPKLINLDFSVVSLLKFLQRAKKLIVIFLAKNMKPSSGSLSEDNETDWQSNRCLVYLLHRYFRYLVTEHSAKEYWKTIINGQFDIPFSWPS